MREVPIHPEEPSRWRPGAWHGALVASLALLSLAAWREQLDLVSVGVAAAAIALSALFLVRAARAPRLGQDEVDGGRASAADALLGRIPTPLILVDSRSTVLEANAAAFALFPALAKGAPLSLALRAPDVLDGVASVLGGRETVTVEHDERFPAERAFEIQIGAIGLGEMAFGAEGGLGRPGALLFFREVTEARRLERMRVDFIANASHELRTPLASLVGFIETLQGPARKDAAAREKFLSVMQAQAQRMKRLVDDLLSLSRIELNEHVEPKSPVDLAAVAHQIAEMLSQMAKDEGVTLTFMAPERPLVVTGDRDELLRLAENLTQNAIRYGAGGKRVEVEVTRLSPVAGRGGEVELSVRDHGPGIAPEHLPRLTERFYRVDATESRNRGGTGLGLAIVKHILTRHKGRLVIESRLGEGARFRAILPEAPAAVMSRDGTNGRPGAVI